MQSRLIVRMCSSLRHEEKETAVVPYPTPLEPDIRFASRWAYETHYQHLRSGFDRQ
jgi:hypothetical protein